jgi:N-acetylmuramoyl-L-alanine amidase
MRTIFILFLLFTTTLGIPVALFAKGKLISKIVLDAGHGGKDFGAQGAVSKEKDITLDITLKLGKILADSMKSVQVIYTRTTDDYPSLESRHEIANKANADLYVCVHVNSTPYTYTRTLAGYKTVKKHHKTVKVPVYNSVRHHVTSRTGVETYVMALHRTGQQNEAIGEYSENVTSDPGLINTSDPQAAIIIAQYSQAFLNKSVTLGSKIQEQFALEGRPDLGVKQLPLEVLAGSAMPGVLVEVGFITNITEEAYLNSEKGQHEVAMAIFRGIRAYKEDAEK